MTTAQIQIDHTPVDGFVGQESSEGPLLNYTSLTTAVDTMTHQMGFHVQAPEPENVEDTPQKMKPN